MTSARVERCRLAFVCGQAWEALEHLPDNDCVRHCVRCQAAVHLAIAPAAVGALAAQGRCVAVAQTLGYLALGRPEVLSRRDI